MDNVKDGFLSAQEFGNIPDCPTSNPVCCEAGKYCVTKHFVLLDKDKDGKLSRQEYEAGDMAGSWMNYPGEEKHWLAQHPDVEQWFISSQLRTRSRRLNMTNCDELEAAIDEECTYNGTQVTEFTKAMKKNGGDFTISFWVKPTGANSLVSDLSQKPMFVPQVLCMPVQLYGCMHVPLCVCLTNQLTTNHNSTQIWFYGKTTPPQAQVGFGLWHTNPNGEVRVDSKCGRGIMWPYENVPLSDSASTSEWTFISVVRKNSTSNTYLQTATNLLKFSEAGELAPGGLCLFDPESMINALEMNYPMLISPIMLIPEAIPFANVQQAYLQGRTKMVSRQGPRLSARVAKEETAIVVKKQDFASRTVLIAPPIIFQVCVSACVCVRVCTPVHAYTIRIRVRVRGCRNVSFASTPPPPGSTH